MRQSKARRERHARQAEYKYWLRQWELAEPPKWRIFAHRKWKADKPQYNRR